MGEIKNPRPVLLLIAVISRHPSAFDWTRAKAAKQWGEIALQSETFSFVETQYYERTMGQELKKVFLAFEQLIDAAELVQAKHLTNEWEAEYAQLYSHEESRPLNLDPGYLTEAKLVLATTKDRDHRIYLDRGIYSEVTLYFHRGRWRPRDWTYPDYRREDFHEFFDCCRHYLRQRYG